MSDSWNRLIRTGCPDAYEPNLAVVRALHGLERALGMNPKVRASVSPNWRDRIAEATAMATVCGAREPLHNLQRAQEAERC